MAWWPKTAPATISVTTSGSMSGRISPRSAREEDPLAEDREEAWLALFLDEQRSEDADRARIDQHGDRPAHEELERLLRMEIGGWRGERRLGPQRGHHQVSLRRIAPVDRGLRDACIGRHRLDRGPAVALPDEVSEGGCQDPLVDVGVARTASNGCRRLGGRDGFELRASVRIHLRSLAGRARWRAVSARPRLVSPSRQVAGWPVRWRPRSPVPGRASRGQPTPR